MPPISALGMCAAIASTGTRERVAVEQAVDQVQVARAAAAGADRELAGEMGLGAGRESRRLLVAGMHPVDVFCRRSESVMPFRLSPTTP